MSISGLKLGKLINPACPVNWDHPLNVGRLTWWLGVPNPGWTGARQVRDLCGHSGHKPSHATFSSTSNTWQPPAGRKGGYACWNNDVSSSGHDIACTGIPRASAATQKATFCAWIRPTSLAAYTVILENRASSQLLGLIMSGAGGNPLTCVWNNTAGEYDFGSGPTLATNTWQFVAATVDGSTISLYRVSPTVAFKTVNITITATNRDMTGAWSLVNDTTAGGRGFLGRKDDVSIWSRVLTAGEIRAYYQESCQGHPNTLQWLNARGWTIPPVVVTSAGDGSASGTSTVSGTGASTAAATASAAGTSTVAGVGASTAAATASASGTGTVSGVGASTAAATASTAGTSTAAATGAATAAGVGASAGTATATAVGAALAASAAAAAGTATAAGVGTSTATADGASAGVAAVAGVGAATAAATASATGTSTATAAGTVIVAATATASGATTTAAVGAGTAAATGSSAGTSSASAIGVAFALALAEASGTSTAAATGASTAAGAASASGTSTAAGDGASLFAGSGLSQGVATALATGASLAAGAGTAAGTSSALALGVALLGAVRLLFLAGRRDVPRLTGLAETPELEGRADTPALAGRRDRPGLTGRRDTTRTLTGSI